MIFVKCKKCGDGYDTDFYKSCPYCKEVLDPMAELKQYIIEDLDKLTSHEIGQVYKYIRKLISGVKE